MVLPTGTISLSDVNVELGFPSTSTISLDDALVRCLAGPTFLTPGTQISMNDLRGKANRLTATGGAKIVSPDGYTYHIFNSPGSLVITGKCTGSVTIQSWLVGGGGGGGGNPGGSGAAGGGGGGRVLQLSLSVGPGSITWPVTIGAGGAGGSSPSSGQPGFGPNITGSNTGFTNGGTPYRVGAGGGGNLETGSPGTFQPLGQGAGGGGGAAAGGATYSGGPGFRPGGNGGSSLPSVFGGGGGSTNGPGQPGPVGGAGGPAVSTGWPGIPTKGAGGTGGRPNRSGGNGPANSGQGGGGGSLGGNGGNGGSGSLIFRYLTAN